MEELVNLIKDCNAVGITISVLKVLIQLILK